MNVASTWMIANIASHDALILPHRANPAGLNFRELQGPRPCESQGDSLRRVHSRPDRPLIAHLGTLQCGNYNNGVPKVRWRGKPLTLPPAPVPPSFSLF